MRKILITLDEELDPWLATKANQTETVRTALRVYKEHISTEVMAGLRESYKKVLKETEQINKRLDNMDANIASLAKKAGSEYIPDEFSEFGA